MDVLTSLGAGFSVLLEPANLGACFIGVFLGTLIGVLPGIGPVGAMAMLLPVTFSTTPEASLIMLAGIYYGSMYGGSTTSILVNTPGEAASVVTCLDGHQMARQGRAGPALGMCAFGSFFGGTLSIVGLMLVAPPLASFALRFGPPEFFSLLMLGLVLLVYLAQVSILKALVMAGIGFLLGLVGLDLINGAPRFTFGQRELYDGIGIAPLVMGLFAISEVLMNAERSITREVFTSRIRNLLPSLEDWKISAAPIARGSVLGFLLGILPGGGAILSSFVDYALEKRLSKHPERFGHGAIEGVAGPETANNAATGGAFIPLMTLGIPANAVMALLLAALMIHGVEPGPLMIQTNPAIFWSVVASMYIGNIMLLVLNLPLIGMWVQLLKVPYGILGPLILLFCVVGVYTVNNSVFDLYLLIGFGVFGYVSRKFGFEGAPLVLAFVIGPRIEGAFRQSLLLSDGDFSIFVSRPISAICLGLSALVLLSSVLPWLRRRRRLLAYEEE